MPPNINTIPNVLRIATITKVDGPLNGPKICTLSFANGEKEAYAPLPHPMAAKENGIFMTPKENSQVIVGRGDSNTFFIVSYYSGVSLSSNSGQAKFPSRPIDYSPPPLDSKPGEVIINGSRGAYTIYDADGNITSRFGDIGSVSLSSKATIGTSAKASYTSLASGYSVSGEVLREVNPIDSLKNTDRLGGISFDAYLKPIGREKLLPVSSSTTSTSIHRNPPFVESRSVMYEYARDYLVNNPTIEKDLYKESGSKKGIKDLKLERQGSRTDAFGLGPLQYNVLSETILGTAVDVYGNVLDLNRNPILDVADPKSPEKQIEKRYEALRRSIKFHFEINSRKPTDNITLDTDNPAFIDGPLGHFTDHSRWSIDVDAEGQTKINIPASSSTGNVPVHARYISSSFLARISETDSDLTKTHYLVRNPGSSDSIDSINSDQLRQDIVHYNYATTSSSSGLELDDEYAPQSQGTNAFRWTMPYHDPAFNDILKLKTFLGVIPTWYYPYNGIDPQTDYLSLIGKVISAQALTNSPSGYVKASGVVVPPNAGGRSLSMNLDGSLELAVGADQADGKSVVLDTAGSMLARVGKDKNDNSIVLAADGNATLIVGASNKSGEAIRIPGGNLKIFVENANGGCASIEVISGNIHVRSAPGGNIVFESSRNIIMSAGRDVLINGERIGVFGEYSADGDIVKAGKGGVGERPIKRTGEEI